MIWLAIARISSWLAYQLSTSDAGSVGRPDHVLRTDGDALAGSRQARAAKSA